MSESLNESLAQMPKLLAVCFIFVDIFFINVKCPKSTTSLSNGYIFHYYINKVSVWPNQSASCRSRHTDDKLGQYGKTGIIMTSSWHEYQSNIWSSDTKTYMRLIITERNEKCLQYVQSR